MTLFTARDLRVDDFTAFVKARHDIFLARARLAPKPWTKDSILQRYRFCNVYRELDIVTQWIAQNWREPLAALCNPDLWFWMLVARLVNHPDTLLRLQFSSRGWNWDAQRFIKVIESMQWHGAKAWGGAYIVSTNGRQIPKAQYIATEVLTPAWELRKHICPEQHATLRSFCDRLLQLNGVQGFIAGQVIADAKYGDEFLAEASDWHTFAVSGPGSRRGLNRALNVDYAASWKESEWHEALLLLRTATNNKLQKYERKGRPQQYPLIHAQDIQNCLCEFDKYERVRLGQGKPRSSYPGT